MFPVVIPTIGRYSGFETWKWLSGTDRRVTLAVHLDEYQRYKDAFPRCNIMVLSEGSRQHVGRVRAEIIEMFHEPFFFVDDDIKLSWKTVFHPEAMFQILEGHIQDGAWIAGLGQQLYSNFAIDSAEISSRGDRIHRNKFVATVYAIDPDRFRTCPLQELPVYEDVALVIHAAPHVVVSYCATHNNRSPKQGGCNGWRTPEITMESLDALVRLYPGICTKRETKHTTHSQNIGVGLRVAWSKLKEKE